MLVPLYEAVHERLEVGLGTRLLGLGCGSGLALLLAANRGAAVTGVDASPELLDLARERLLPRPAASRARGGVRLVEGGVGEAGARGGPYTVVTAFDPFGWPADDPADLAGRIAEAVVPARRGAAVVLAGWGPPERCATSSVLRVATKLADPLRGGAGWRPARRDDLEQVAERAGLRPDGSGRVACPFGYADLDSAVRGLLSTGAYDAATAASDRAQVDKELTEALHPYVRDDGTVWMPNVFRYLVARTP